MSAREGSSLGTAARVGASADGAAPVSAPVVVVGAGLAGMVTAVLGPAEPADVEPMTGVTARLAESRTPNQLSQFGISPASARTRSQAVAAYSHRQPASKGL